jgi:hypothetical protein
MKRLWLGFALLAAPAVAASQRDSRAVLVADLLARIDRQSAKPTERRALARDLRTLDRLGAHPADGAEDPRAAWRKAARVLRESDYRGRVLGPAYSRGWIEPGQAAHMDQQFLAGQRATVAVSSIGGTLALNVTDPERSSVCRAQPRSCVWLPLYTQRYTITLSNRGPNRLRYYLVVD